MHPQSASSQDDLFSREDLRGIALLALAIAHGADEDLDTREIDAIADRLLVLESSLSGDDVIVVFRDAAKMYALRDMKTEDLIIELAHSLDMGSRRRAFALLRAVAEADGVIHPGESAILHEAAERWEIGPAFVSDGSTGADF
jgi:hypothetical protein